MKSPLYSDRDKIKLIEYCKQHIEENGYCSTKYALEQAVDTKSFLDNNHRRAFFKSVSSLITKDGRYKIKYKYSDETADVEYNPDYKEKSFFEKHPFVEKLTIVVITAALTFSINLYITTSQKQSQKDIDNKQNQNIKVLQDTINSLRKR